MLKKANVQTWLVFIIFFIICFAFKLLNVNNIIVILVFVICYFILSLYLFRATLLGELGYFYYLTGKYELSIKLFEKACSYNTSSVNCLYQYSLILTEKNELQKALQLLLRAKTINKKPLADKFISIGLGNCYWLLNEIDKSIDIFLKLESKYDNLNFNSYTTLGFLFLLKEDFENAMIFTNKALACNSEYAPAFDNLGQIYLKQNKLDLAIENFLTAINLNNKMADSNYNLGIVYEIKGDTKLAKKYFLQAHDCNINIYNTVSKDEIEKKYLEYNFY